MQPPWKLPPPPTPPPPPWQPPPPPPLPPAHAMVGETRPTDATANNAIIVLCNIVTLLEDSLPTTNFSRGGDRFAELLSRSGRRPLNSARAPIKFGVRKRGDRAIGVRRGYRCKSVSKCRNEGDLVIGL